MQNEALSVAVVGNGRKAVAGGAPGPGTATIPNNPNSGGGENDPLVFRESGEFSMGLKTDDDENMESMRLDIIEDPNYQSPTHKESMR